MIQLRTVLNVADNSGAKKLRVVHVHGGSKRRFGYLNDILTCSVIKSDPEAPLKKGKLVKAILVRVKKEHRRPDGSYVRFDDNAAVILESVASKTIKGTRIIGPIAREIKEAGFTKIASKALEIV